MDVRPTRPRRWPLGLVGMLALVALVESSLARLPDLPHPWAIDWQQGVRAVSTRAKDSRVLCFGDSLMKYGVVASILADRLGRPTYNLALGASPPPVSLAMLRRALDAGAKPDAILVDFVPHLLSEPPSFSELLLPEVLRPEDVVQLGWDARDPGLAGRVILARLLPSVRNRMEARGAVVAALAGDPRMLRAWNLEAGRRNWRKNRGAHIAPRTPRHPGDDGQWTHHLYPESWHVDPINERAVERFFQLAADHQVPVFWVIAPFSPEVHARRATVAGNLDARYDEFVARLRAKFPSVTLLDGRASGYDIAVHTDALHLDRRGAAVFTEDVAAAVRARLDHPGGPGAWVQLPPFRDRPADRDLEDSYQSLLATQRQVEASIRR